jgi:phosphatidylglycerol:prolipoprotein diacylglycerol transferase
MPTLAAILHTLDPFIVQFTPSFGLRWYGLLYASGLLCAWMIMRAVARRGRAGLTQRQVDDFITEVVIGVVVGARLGHALIYDRVLFTTFTPSLPFWELLAVHKGGLSSHGGMAGLLVVCWRFARRSGASFRTLLDLCCISAPPGLCLGRMANWINGELWGRPLPQDLQANAPWWCVKYPREVFEPSFDPSRLEPLRPLVHAGDDLQQAVVAAAYAGDAKVQAALEPLLTAFWPSNFFQAFTDGPVLAVVVWIVWLRRPAPGVATASFLVAYGVLRFITEQFREPDAGVNTLLGLTSPMLISVAMIVIGAVLAVAWRSRSRAA